MSDIVEKKARIYYPKFWSKEVLRTLVKNNKLTKEAYKRITNEDYEQQFKEYYEYRYVNQC